jgi:hypothetical protein
MLLARMQTMRDRDAEAQHDVLVGEDRAQSGSGR